jgi:hypothetical protein
MAIVIQMLQKYYSIPFPHKPNFSYKDVFSLNLLNTNSFFSLFAFNKYTGVWGSSHHQRADLENRRVFYKNFSHILILKNLDDKILFLTVV